jgi:hypothetical protein
VRQRRIGPRAVHARRPEPTTLRVDEPPAIVDLFDPEKAGGFAALAGEAAVTAGSRRTLRHEHAFLRLPFPDERRDVARLARPIGVNVLPVVIDQRRTAIENRVARVGLREAHLANLEGRGAGGISHRDADRAHGVHGRMAAGFDVDPVARARLIDGRGELIGVAEPVAEETHRYRGPRPDSGERVDTFGDVALVAHQAELEALAGRAAKLDHEESCVSPIRRQRGIDFGDGPLRRGNFARESRLEHGAVSANNHRGQQERGDPRAAKLHSNPLE